MTNLQFDLTQTISINALTLVCSGFTDFDVHQKGLYLSEYLLYAAPLVLKKKKPSKVKEFIGTDNSSMGCLLEPSKIEHAVMTKLNQIRDQVTLAIDSGNLTIDKLSTEDCCEIRLQIDSAMIWCNEQFNHDYSEFYANGIKPIAWETIHLTIEALRRLYLGKIDDSNLSHDELERRILNKLEDDRMKLRTTGTISRLLSESEQGAK